MDSFDNFQYESASSYGGGIGIVDDNSSVYTANTQDQDPDNGSSVDLSSLSIADSENGAEQHAGRGDDDLETGFLEDVFVLPPHACRCVVRFDNA
jgi:regulator of nonsense transcripts 1